MSEEQNSIMLFKGQSVKLKKDLTVDRGIIKKGTVGLVIKGGAKKQVIKFLLENGDTPSYSADFSQHVEYSDEEFKDPNAVVLKHGMKVELLEDFKIKKLKFKKGAIGIVIREGDIDQRIMFEEANGWFYEITGEFSTRVKVLNKQK